MQPASFIRPVAKRALVAYGLALCALTARLLVPPLVVAILAGELGVAAIIAAIAGGAWALGALRGDLPAVNALEMRDALVLTALAYPAFALVIAAPLLTVARPLDAFFEAMSGITTTGLSVIPPDSIGPSLIFLRAYAQWLGGAGIIVLSLALVFGTGRASLELWASEHAGEGLVGNVRTTARAVLRIYAAMTALAVAGLLLAGLTPFDALVHALSGVSTGGFSSRAQSVGAFEGHLARLAFIPIMLLGATSFPAIHRAWTDGWRVLLREPQVPALLGLTAAVAGLCWASEPALGAAPADATEATFRAVSSVTTTGFATSEPSAWSAPTRALLIAAMVVGGCGGSTAGGIKLRRLIILLKSVTVGLARLSLPREAVTSQRYGGQVVDGDELQRILGFVVLYGLFLTVSTGLLIGGGEAPSDALFESASALGTVGLSTGMTAPGLAAWKKLVLIVDMWAGRLEILPVLLVFYRRTWIGAPGRRDG